MLKKCDKRDSPPLQNENHPAQKVSELDRRAFLLSGGAGIAALAYQQLGTPWLTASRDAATALERTPPVNPIVLKSRQLELVLDRRDGLPFTYRLTPSGEVFFGEASGEPLHATICALEPWKFAAVPLATSSVKANRADAKFVFEAKIDGKLAASFTLHYAVEGSAVHVGLDNVQERLGFELIDVVLPRLVTLREEEAGAWLAHGDDGGSLVMLSDAKPAEFPPNRFWGNVMASLPVVMAGRQKAACVLETTAYMDSTLISVVGEPGHRRAWLGTVQNFRVNGSLCYDMNTGNGTPHNCGNAKTPNLLVGQAPACRLDFVTAAAGKDSVDWLDAARVVRSRMPAVPNRYYDGKFIYGIRCDEPKFQEPAATFEECQGIIRNIAAMTGRSPQIAQLWGWQYRGKDTGYPAVAEVNPRLGGLDALRTLLAEGPKHHCRVTFSDNYDDAYRSSPAWDPSIIARRPDGELWLSRNWTGEDSYIIGLAKYMAGPGPERVRFTCDHYGIRDTIHVDVLSYYTVRNDWDPQHPASGIANLLDGRYRVIDEFKKRGVDLTSEAMRYGMIGKISFFWHITSARPCPFGGKPIPLQPMIYRKSASWGEAGDRGALIDRLMNSFFYNGCMHLILRKDTDYKDVTDLYYLNLVPWFSLKNRNIESFHREGEHTTIGLEGDSRIEQDWAAKTYSITVDGVEIARDLATYCLLDADRLAFYAQTARELSAPLPKGWDAAAIAAFALSTAEPQVFTVHVSEGRIIATVPARQPVIVCRNAAASESLKAASL